MREPATDPRNVVVRLAAFTKERFPPPPQLILVALLWATGVTMPYVLAGASGFHLDEALLALAGLLLLMFHLRVMDDVKDAGHDREHEPDRPIPRGLISEREADVLWLLLVLLELPLFLALGQMVMFWWVATVVFTILMRVEFFVPRFLDRHVLTFATSHMASMALVFILLAHAGIAATASWHTPEGDQLIRTTSIAAIVAFCLGMGFELGRKFERYQLAHGHIAWILWALMPSLGVVGFANLTDSYPTWVWPVMLAIAGLTIVSHLVVVIRTWKTHARSTEVDPAIRGYVEMLPGVAGLLTYLVLGIAGFTVVL